MRLIEQVRLEYRQGNSDKVYEVDLCEVGPGQFVVNFRYGRRGTALRDGSKTPAPVALAKAESIYDKLVASKRNEGYVDLGTSPPVAASGPLARPRPSPPPPAAPPPRVPAPKQSHPETPAREPRVQPRDETDAEGRKQGVLNRLREGFAPRARSVPARKHWRLSRAIWRAGELGLREAEPLLLQLLAEVRSDKSQRGRQRRQFNRDLVADLLGERTMRLPHGRWGWAQWSDTFSPPEDLFLYVLAWSLGRCGSAASVPALRELLSESWPPVGRIATAALLLLLEGRPRAELIEELTVSLPEALLSLCRSGPAEAFQQAVTEYLARADAQPAAVLDTLYLIDNANVRPAVLHLLRTLPLRSACFPSIRHVFKIAELRRDAEVFGILAHRFETGPLTAPEVRPEVGVMRYQNGQVAPARAVLTPFKDTTRLYLRLRTWRTLRRLGEVGDPAYVRLATGVLLPFSDADGQSSRDGFDRFWAFSQIVHRNSPHYEPNPRKGRFVHKPAARGRGRERALIPEVDRVEAFPELWTAAPEVLLPLLGGRRCELVHVFAVRILRDLPDFCRQLDVSALIRLLAAPYEVTLELALDLAIQRCDPDPPDNELVLALANCGLARARAQAREWIEEQRDRFTKDVAFLAGLAGSPQAETRTFARELLRQTAFTPAVAQVLIARLVALLRTFTAEEGERARDTALTLQLAFAAPLRLVGVAVIRDLLDHALPEVRRFAGEIMLAHDTLGRWPPEDVLLRLLQDSEASVRGVGVRLLGQLPDDTLKQSLDLLVGLSRHELSDFRENIRPVVKRLADADSEFGRRIAERFLEALLVPGAPEGVPSHTARLLREDLRQHLAAVPAATIWRLLQARSPVAQEVGGMLLATNVRPADLTLEEIVKLAGHDILAVREAAWQMCRASLDRLKKDMDTATRLVDAKWEDSRQFAFGLLRDAFSRGELTPTVLVSLCDSVRPDVQQFGREMITRLFAEENGPEYAIKLSEHPSPSMQMFAANFLERYAGDSPERLRELTFYFQSVLSRVNQGRIAKERVFNFLKKAAAAGEESARAVAEVLGRQSATASIRDRARAIEVLTGIHAAHPAIPMPLRILPVEVRNGV